MPKASAVVPKSARFGENVRYRARTEVIIGLSPLKWPGVQRNIFGCLIKCAVGKLGRADNSMQPDSGLIHRVI